MTTVTDPNNITARQLLPGINVLLVKVGTDAAGDPVYALSTVGIDPATGNIPTAGGGGGAATIADGADVAQGAKGDSAVTNPALSASEIALLKGMVTLLGNGIDVNVQDGADGALGSMGDLAASSDAGSFNLIQLIKRMDAKFTTQLPAALAANGGLKVEGVANGVGLPVSLYAKNVAAGDTAIGVDSNGNVKTAPNAVLYSVDTTMQTAATATGNGTAADISGMVSMAVQVVISATATITFEVTVDGTNWIALKMADANTGFLASTATASGIYRRNIASFKQLRARISSYGSGTVTATGHAISGGVAGIDLPISNTDGGSGSNNGYPVAVALHNGGNNGQPMLIFNTDAFSGNFMLGVANGQWNPAGGTWERLRGNYEATLLASAARTVTTPSADQVAYNNGRLIVIVNVTSAGTGSITPSLQIKDSISGNYFTVWTAAAALVANGTYAYEIGPGAVSAASWTEIAQLFLTRTWRLNMVANNANSVTYSVSGAAVL